MKNQYKIYQVWKCEDESLTLATEKGIAEQMNIEGSKPIEKIHEFLAATPEEAASIYYLRMGHAPYKPMGKPELCPNCENSYVYASSNCPYCGKI